ncbi:MAG: TetR/AcrR family transcriptional regulator [Pseudomonadales bacterium]|nr:TetR/AcrR family transcriptional regulator [Pseudomonadales bacterium]
MIRQRSQSSIGTIYHHFGNKEGLVAAIFLAALDDLQAHIGPAMEAAPDLRGAIEAMVRSYLAWVTEQPTLARFMFQARSLVASGEHKSELETRNKQRYGALIKRLAEAMESGVIRPLPKETYASLLIGQSENYCRAWLSGRVKGAPAEQAEVFAQAAWRAVASEV